MTHIELARVSYAYAGNNGAVAALSEVSFDVAASEFVCIVGRSGCGKTTLLNILAGFETATRGDLLLDGAPVARAGRDRVVFFQNADAALFPWLTAEDNVAFGLRVQGMARERRGPIVERYLRLGLQVGRHVDGIVDAYYGPPELAAAVDAAPPVDPRVLVGDAQALLGEVEDGWLRDQVVGLSTYAGVLAGDTTSYADEVEGCYGVRPTHTDEAVFAAAH